MKKSRFTDGQITEAIKRAEAGLAMPELGVSSVTFYKWQERHSLYVVPQRLLTIRSSPASKISN